MRVSQYLGRHPGLVFDVLAESGGLLGDAVAVETVDLIFDAQRLRLLVLISWDHRGDTRSETDRLIVLSAGRYKIRELRQATK